MKDSCYSELHAGLELSLPIAIFEANTFIAQQLGVHAEPKDPLHSRYLNARMAAARSSPKPTELTIN